MSESLPRVLTMVESSAIEALQEFMLTKIAGASVLSPELEGELLDAVNAIRPTAKYGAGLTETLLYTEIRSALEADAAETKQLLPPLNGYNLSRVLTETAYLLAAKDRQLERINNPLIDEFLPAVENEMRHQIAHRADRHGDATKNPSDWYWLLSHLSGKILHAASAGDKAKALHHAVTSAAVLGNWFIALQSGAGIEQKERYQVDLPSFDGYQPHIVRELQAAFIQQAERAGLTVSKDPRVIPNPLYSVWLWSGTGLPSFAHGMPIEYRTLGQPGSSFLTPLDWQGNPERSAGIARLITYWRPYQLPGVDSSEMNWALQKHYFSFGYYQEFPKAFEDMKAQNWILHDGRSVPDLPAGALITVECVPAQNGLQRSHVTKAGQLEESNWIWQSTHMNPGHSILRYQLQ